MAHPIFNAPRFPFNRPDAKELFQVLGILYGTVAEIQTVFQDLGANWGRINTAQGVEFVWREALDELCKSGYLESFCLQLVNRQPPLRLDFLQVVEAARNATYTPPPRPVISDRLFMLDRIPIREKLALLADDTAQEKVILIRGSKASGKTHCRHLFQEKARETGADFKYIPAGLVTDVRETIDQLFSHFNRMNEVPPVETTAVAWYRKVCLKLKEIAATNEKQLWIAMDDLGYDEQDRPMLPDEVRLFFNQFALQMIDPAFSKWFRLMLIHYPEGVPTEWTQDFWTEPDNPIQENDIQASHVAECLLAWADSNNRKITPDDLTAYAISLVNTVDSFQHKPGEIYKPRLKRIHEELARIIKDLKAQPV